MLNKVNREDFYQELVMNLAKSLPKKFAKMRSRNVTEIKRKNGG
jgi:hypothetical protein